MEEIDVCDEEFDAFWDKMLDLEDVYNYEDLC